MYGHLTLLQTSLTTADEEEETAAGIVAEFKD